MTSHQIHFDIPNAQTAATDTAQSTETTPRRRRRRKKIARGMVYGCHVNRITLLDNLRKRNAVISEDLYEVGLEFKRTFCRMTNRPGTTKTFIPVENRSGFCVRLSKGAAMETEIDLLKELLETEEPKWYRIDTHP